MVFVVSFYYVNCVDRNTHLELPIFSQGTLLPPLLFKKIILVPTRLLTRKRTDCYLKTPS